MRLCKASTSVTAVAVAAVAIVALSGVSPAQAQQPGDPVTYTQGRVVYTAILDPDLDTVSASPVQTVAAGGAAAAAGVLSTTYDVNGNPVTISNGVTLGATATAAQGAQQAAGGVSIDEQSNKDGNRTSADIGKAVEKSSDDLNVIGNDKVNSIIVTDIPMHEISQQDEGQALVFQHNYRRSLSTPIIDQPMLERRQAALGGGGGVQTTQTALQTISGYTPPDNTQVPQPNNFSSGSILVPSQIPGYTGKENSQGLSSSGIRLNAGSLVLGGAVGAAVFAML